MLQECWTDVTFLSTFPLNLLLIKGFARFRPVIVHLVSLLKWHMWTARKSFLLIVNEICSWSSFWQLTTMKWGENSAFSRSVRWALCWLNALLNWVELGVYLCVCVHTWGHGCVDWVFVRMCVCVSWRCLKVVLTVHTQTAPEESASLVDPLCIFCVCV